MSDTFDHEMDAFDSRERAADEERGYRLRPQRKAHGSGLTVTSETKPRWNDEEWTMEGGKKIWVTDMTESHAKNCLRVLIRRINKHNLDRENDWLENLWHELRAENYGCRD